MSIDHHIDTNKEAWKWEGVVIGPSDNLRFCIHQEILKRKIIQWTSNNVRNNNKLYLTMAK